MAVAERPPLGTLGFVPPAGNGSGLQIISKDAWVPEELQAKLRTYNPKSELGIYIRECLRYLPPEMAAELIERASRVVAIETQLRVVTFHPRPDGSVETRDYGVTCKRVVTTAGVNYIVSSWNNAVELENFKYHGIGTNTATAPVIGDTALVAELTTQYSTDNTRATGSLTTGGSSNVFRSVGTNTVDASVTIGEFGLFTQAATGGGTMFDRLQTGGNALSSGDSIQTTFDCTFTAGG